MIARAERGEQVVDTEFPVEDRFDVLAPPKREAIAQRGISAFVTVQEGCDKFCTFCVVPYTRGAEISRPVAKIVAEVERLASAGVREVTLIGQNVNGYHGLGDDGAPASLGKLLRRLAQVPGIARLRYTTSHPNDMDDDLIAAHGDLPALMPYVHLPVQSGSDRMLAAMNRRHTRAAYLDVDRAAAACAARPRLHLGLHRRLPGRNRAGFPRHPGPGRGSRFRRRLHLRLFAAPRNAGGRPGRPGSTGGEIRTVAAVAGPDHAAWRGPSMPALAAAPSMSCWKSRADSLGNWSAGPHICRRYR